MRNKGWNIGILISFCVVIMFTACKSNGDNKLVLEKLNSYEIQQKSSIWNLNREWRRDVEQWSYITGYELTEGQSLRDSGYFDISVRKGRGKIHLEFVVNLEHFAPFPTIYNRDFNKQEESDYLNFKLEISNNQNRKIIQIKDRTDLNEHSATFHADLDMDHFHTLKTGPINFDVKLVTAFASFFGVESTVRPVKARFTVNFMIPTIHHTKLHFKTLTLNETKTMDFLGNNDWNNPIPETGISVKLGDKSILYTYSKNNFTCDNSTSADIYHFNKEAFVLIKLLDVDYGVNGNDLIEDTLIKLSDLESDDYKPIKMHFADELLMYSEYIGITNE